MKSLFIRNYWPVLLMITGMLLLWWELSHTVAFIVLVCVSFAWVSVIHNMHRAYRQQSEKKEKTEGDIQSSINSFQKYASSVSNDIKYEYGCTYQCLNEKKGKFQRNAICNI